MPYRVTYALDIFRGDAERDLSRESLNIMLACLFQLDMAYLRRHPEAPSVYQSGVRYMEEPPGQEEWQDVPTCLRMGTADCVPVTSLVMVEGRVFRPIGSLVVGERIFANGVWTAVKDIAMTGLKKVLAFALSNGGTLRCTPEHRLFQGMLPSYAAISSDKGRVIGSEVRAREIVPGDYLRALGGMSVMVEGIVEENELVPCCDITTEHGEFYLPESDLIVHNCEDLACWRAAELNVRQGVKAVPFFREQKRADGSYLYHILVRHPPTPQHPQGFVEDPSRVLGMR